VNFTNGFFLLYLFLCNNLLKEGDVMSLGEQLKKLRESKGFSQEDVAKKIGVTRQAVYKVKL